ncbi:unnamed protein product [Prunus armeniaca]|uniref:Uncharacterized protein n=1 Tax=Prunus armeniaca TaxID=36596 RepID=A0A6J5VX57_PRUAR|nr:unnamed protein product [Prunus armeniaca]
MVEEDKGVILLRASYPLVAGVANGGGGEKNQNQEEGREGLVLVEAHENNGQCFPKDKKIYLSNKQNIRKNTSIAARDDL